MAADSLNIKISVDGSALAAGLSQASEQVEAAGAKMKASMEGAGVGSEKLTYSMRESREALRGVSEELGVHLPRFVSSFLASVGPVGGAMGGDHIHLHVHAVDASGVQDFFDKHSSKIVGTLARAKREFRY